MFEAGAAWATRGRSDYDILTTRFADCPVYLHGGTQQIEYLNGEGKVELSLKLCSEIIKIVNIAIDHLNAGRRTLGKSEIEMYDVPPDMTEHEKRRSGKTLRDILGEDLYNNFEIACERWKESTTAHSVL